MDRSTAVESFIEEMYASMRDGDGKGCADMLDDEVTIFIGTDGDEWWDTPAASKAAFQEQLESTGGFDISAGGPVGYADGDIGWGADQPTMRIGDQSVPMRMTAVMRRVDGNWRIVQGHLSVAANINQDLFK
jgi:hypothetical protein